MSDFIASPGSACGRSVAGRARACAVLSTPDIAAALCRLRERIYPNAPKPRTLYAPQLTYNRMGYATWRLVGPCKGPYRQERRK